MFWSVFISLLMVVGVHLEYCVGVDCHEFDYSVGTFEVALVGTHNDVVLYNVPFELELSLSCFYAYDNVTKEYVKWPTMIPYQIYLGTQVIRGVISNPEPGATVIFDYLRSPSLLFFSLLVSTFF
jgi:hypothetical protein